MFEGTFCRVGVHMFKQHFFLEVQAFLKIGFDLSKTSVCLIQSHDIVPRSKIKVTLKSFWQRVYLPCSQNRIFINFYLSCFMLWLKVE